LGFRCRLFADHFGRGRYNRLFRSGETRFGLNHGKFWKFSFQFGRFLEYWRDKCRLRFGGCWFEPEGFSRQFLRGLDQRGLRMAAAHNICVEAFLNYGTRTGFDHSLSRYRRGALRALVEVGLDPFSLVRGEQA
jgi:hypothetical protein